MVLLGAARDLAKLAEVRQRAYGIRVPPLLDESFLAVVPHAHLAVHRASDQKAILRHHQHLLDGLVVGFDHLEERIRVHVPDAHGAVLRPRQEEVAIECKGGDGIRVPLERRLQTLVVDGPDADLRIVACGDDRVVDGVEAQGQNLVRRVRGEDVLDLRHGIATLGDVPDGNVSVEARGDEQLHAPPHCHIQTAHGVRVLQEIYGGPRIWVPEADRAVVVARD
mmetsp:Transcript_18571/g.54365  ORF Transcript_18571/g.54365 Transcript_18571/m.54365 type:complete len:223 (-) Transcript_18571:1355-2023(-)